MDTLGEGLRIPEKLGLRILGDILGDGLLIMLGDGLLNGEGDLLGDTLGLLKMLIEGEVDADEDMLRDGLDDGDIMECMTEEAVLNVPLRRIG
jgi:hypothetical protein